MTVESQAETRQFQAEVKQVLDLMIHSLYSNKEIFLRELISNASDACDKLRFEAIQDDSLYGKDSELRVTISIDKEAGTVTLSDNGIGMSREEVVENIGTIASSGTRKFLAAMTGDEQKDANLIGQFGVGFYSSFIVADKVTLTTRRAGTAGDEGVRWESGGDGEYSIETVAKADRGTEITLHLKDDEKEFLEGYRVRSTVSKYSDHIGFPIMMLKAADQGEDGEQSAPPEWEAVNEASALWTLPRAEIDDAGYQAFYKHISHDFNDALKWSHNRVEGNQSYVSLIYLPEKAPFDLFTNREERQGLKLYVRRVFIMDAAEQMLPSYLRFVRGVVDSDDLPLNVSRELLQDNPLAKKIRGALVKRVLDMLEKLSREEGDKYQEFWGQFGQVLKEGPVEDFANQQRIAKLLRFSSTHTDSSAQDVSLEAYVSRMPADQKKIYFVTAESHQAAAHSPHLEVFRKKGVEVLLLSERVDEWMMGYLREFDDKVFQSVAKGDLDLGELEAKEDRKQRQEKTKQSKGLLERFEKALGDRVEDVRVSQRLTDSPACLVLAENDMAMHMQALMKQAGHEMPSGKPSLEINPDHLLIKRFESESDDAKFGRWAELVFEQAMLAEGAQLEDPSGFVQRLNELLVEIGSSNGQ